MAVDTETTGLHVWDGRDYAIGVSIAWKDASGKIHSHYFPFRHVPDPSVPDDDGNYDQEDLANLKLLIENAPLIAFHNAKFDLTSLESLGIRFRGRWFDTAVMAYLINENFPASKRLDDLCKHYVGPLARKQKSQELEAWINVFGWGKVPANLMRRYATADAHITLELAFVLYALLAKEGLIDYWFEQKMPLMEVVRQMQLRGVRIDQEYCRRMKESALIHMEDYRELLDNFNPASFKDMNELLCEKLGLPQIFKETKVKKDGKYITEMRQTFNKQAMDEYEPMLARLDSPIAEYVLAYRGWSKAASAFYGAYLEHMSPDGRVRPQYRHHKDDEEGGTLTGRLSCAEPNLQQIPKITDKPWNGGVKQAFIPSPGYELWEVDESQLELRLGTAYTKGEARLRQIFAEGRDIFTEMALDIGLPRQDTKTLVYSMQYGAGIKRLMRALGLSEENAKRIRDTYFNTYPGFKDLADNAKNRALRNKEVRLWTGRKRHFANPQAEAHKALNSMIQGGAADIVERLMIRLWNEVDQASNGEVRMLLQVHDSVIFEIKQGTSDKWVPIIEDIMSDVDSLHPDFENNVRFAVEAKPLHERYQAA